MPATGMPWAAVHPALAASAQSYQAALQAAAAHPHASLGYPATSTLPTAVAGFPPPLHSSLPTYPWAHPSLAQPTVAGFPPRLEHPALQAANAAADFERRAHDQVTALLYPGASAQQAATAASVKASGRKIWVPWPHKMLNKGVDSEEVAYDDLTSDQFQLGYNDHVRRMVDWGERVKWDRHRDEMLADIHDGYPFSQVKAYHKVVLQKMADGLITMDSQPEIQDLRRRIAQNPMGLVKRAVQGNNGGKQGGKQGQSVRKWGHEVLCDAYNGRSGCPETGDHLKDGQQVVHACQQCGRSTGNLVPHSYADCD